VDRFKGYQLNGKGKGMDRKKVIMTALILWSGFAVPVFAVLESAGSGGVESVMVSGAVDFSRNPALMGFSPNLFGFAMAGSYTFTSNTNTGDTSLGNIISFERAEAEREQKDFTAAQGLAGFVFKQGGFAMGAGLHSTGDALFENERTGSKISFYNSGSSSPDYMEVESEDKTVWRPGVTAGCAIAITPAFSIGISGSFRQINTTKKNEKSRFAATPVDTLTKDYKTVERVLSARIGLVQQGHETQIGFFIIPVEYRSRNTTLDAETVNTGTGITAAYTANHDDTYRAQAILCVFRGKSSNQCTYSVQWRIRLSL
jgi:hypothetical protein